MADTFNNDLRVREQEAGSNSGTWGGLLNTTISNLASAFGQGSEAIPNASTHTITLADGAADEARSMYLKCTGGGQACTVTLAPNTISKVWIISNETSYTLTFSQGSGANVAVAAGAVKMIVSDGAGSGAAVTDALSGLSANVSDVTTTGNISFGDNDKAIFGAGSDLQIYHDGSNSYVDDQGTGALFLKTNGTGVFLYSGSEALATFNVNGASNLYYDNGLKLSTTSTGIDVTGTVTADGLEVEAATPILEINSTTTSNTATIQFTSSGTVDSKITHVGNTGILTIDSGRNSSWGGKIAFVTDTEERMRIDSSGNVGIGTGGDNPTALLEVEAASNPEISIASSGGATSNFLNFKAISHSQQVQAQLKTIDNGDFTSDLAFLFKASGTSGALGEKARLTADGNLLVGTTNAGATGLSISNGANLSFAENSNLSYVNIFRQSSSAASVIGNGYKYSSTANKMASSHSSAWARTAISAGYGAIKFFTDAEATVAVGTDITPTEVARIDSTGKLLLGTTGTSFNERLTVNSNSAPYSAHLFAGSGATAPLICRNQNGVSGTRSQIIFYYDASAVGSITSTSSGTALVASSDQRLKENIADADDAGRKVDAIQVRKFDWKADGSHQEYGFVAQELEPVFSHAVHTAEDDMQTKGVDYASLVPMLVKEIQSLRNRVAQLENG